MKPTPPNGRPMPPRRQFLPDLRGSRAGTAYPPPPSIEQLRKRFGRPPARSMDPGFAKPVPPDLKKKIGRQFPKLIDALNEKPIARRNTSGRGTTPRIVDYYKKPPRVKRRIVDRVFKP